LISKPHRFILMRINNNMYYIIKQTNNNEVSQIAYLKGIYPMLEQKLSCDIFDIDKLIIKIKKLGTEGKILMCKNEVLLVNNYTESEFMIYILENIISINSPLHKGSL